MEDTTHKLLIVIITMLLIIMFSINISLSWFVIAPLIIFFSLWLN